MEYKHGKYIDKYESFDTNIYKFHHTSWTKGYISRIDGSYFVEYSGKFGKGYKVFTPDYKITSFHHVSYYIKNVEKEKETMVEKYEKIVSFGGSDSASLICVGLEYTNGKTAKILKFGNDGDYQAYVLNKSQEVPSYYHLVFTFDVWLDVYDDDAKQFEIRAEKIEIYRAGEIGCIIKYYD